MSLFSKPFHHGVCFGKAQFAGFAEVGEGEFRLANEDEREGAVVVGFGQVGVEHEGFAEGIDGAVVFFLMQMAVAQIVP